MSNFQNQTLALASMFQSATLINQLALGESINQAAFDCSSDSLFTLDANSTEEIFGYGDGLIQGLKSLVGYLGGGNQAPDRVIAYYVLSMIKLEAKLMKNPPMIDAVHQGLEGIQQQSGEFDLSASTKIHKIDGLYQQTLSEIRPRVMVQGDQAHLTQSDNTSRIRTLLFAGVRAAVLWRQLGGSRLKLLFSRKKYVQQAEQLLQKLSNRH